MVKLPKWGKTALVWGCVLAGVYLFIRFLVPFILPFIIGLCLARWMEPSVKALQSRLRFPRALGAGIMTALLVGVLLAVVWLAVSRLVHEVSGLVERMPAFLEQLPEITAGWEDRVHGWIDAAPPALREVLSNSFDNLLSGGVSIPSSFYAALAGWIPRAAAAVPSIILFVLATVLGTFLISCDYPGLTTLMLRPFTGPQREKIRAAIVRVAATLGKWLRAQGLMMAITFGILCLGFVILRRPAVLLPAALIAFLDALPVLGAGMCLVPWALFNLAAGDPRLAIGLLILYGVIVLMRGLAEPKLVGSQIGMKALPTFASMYIGYRAFGVMGMVLFPILAITGKQIWESAQSTKEQPAIDKVRR